MKRVPKQHPLIHCCAPARGFTLIELLIAIAILALVAILSWRGLDQIVRAREAVTVKMNSARALAQFFDQFSADARAATADDVMGGVPAIRANQNQLQIARYSDVLGQAPRVQLIRYYRQGQRIIRTVSPLLGTRAALQEALAAPTGVEKGWSTVTLIHDALSFNVRVWIPKQGWINQMHAIQHPQPSQKMPSAESPIHPRSVSGIEIRVRRTGMRRALTRIALAGE